MLDYFVTAFIKTQVYSNSLSSDIVAMYIGTQVYTLYYPISDSNYFMYIHMYH